MIVYHGSDSNFKQLRISKSLVKHRSTLDNEGLGIYFTTDKNIAREYGKYIYTLEINDKYFKDFRHATTCKLYVGRIAQEIYKKYNIDILDYISIEQVADRLRWGGLAIAGTCREIYLLLDSNENWYRLSKTTIEKVYAFLRTYDKKHLQAYMFNYHIPNIGVVKTTDESVVKIVGKEHSY